MQRIWGLLCVPVVTDLSLAQPYAGGLDSVTKHWMFTSSQGTWGCHGKSPIQAEPHQPGSPTDMRTGQREARQANGSLHGGGGPMLLLQGIGGLLGPRPGVSAQEAEQNRAAPVTGPQPPFGSCVPSDTSRLLLSLGFPTQSVGDTMTLAMQGECPSHPGCPWAQGHLPSPCTQQLLLMGGWGWIPLHSPMSL